ncbi:hypothetical protein BURPSS13_T0560 [Burkholderia pseudomallei S13]|nr:hypothetical protein BURPSS13_T0560 [Burkholderia pseudomallei S13]
MCAVQATYASRRRDARGAARVDNRSDEKRIRRRFGAGGP